MAEFFLLLLAFALAWLAFPAIRERLAGTDVPVAWRGKPILGLTCGLMSMAFAGLLGTDRSAGLLIAFFLALFAVISLAFALASTRRRVTKSAALLVEQIDRLLPQTQCGQCGYPGCKPYASAIANGEADINQCPPGGDAGVQALARLLGREPKPLNPENGIEKPKVVALIREPECIGCTKCIQACPVDAIIGASKSMHVVIADLCTGCELCIPPCPVDCIDLVPAEW
jgi:electron transport complex protein RnfB